MASISSKSEQESNFLFKKLNDSLDYLKSFHDSSITRHIKIQNVSLAEFTKPEFWENGKFVDGPTSYRNEYENIVQPYLKGITNPCIYIFELVSPDVKVVFDSYRSFVSLQEENIGSLRRSCASINNSYNLEDDQPIILYVGKSEKPIDGRIVVHFGYYEKGVAGLQLVHWGKKINLKVNIHVFELLQPEYFPYIEAIEKLFFAKLKPIIGKR
jgi:hypothetical protein